MENGWIKLHNKFLKWEWASDPNMVTVWIHLLLSANWKDKNWKGITIKRGQTIIGRKALSKTLGLSERKIRTCLTRLKSTNEIAIKTTNRFSIITIINWDKYQSNDRKRPAERPTKSPTSDQQTTTPKDYKEDKTEHAEQAPPVWVLEEKLQKMEETPNSYLDVIATFIREKPVEVENAKQLSNIIGRYCRIAQKLSGAYTNKQIFTVAERIRKDNEKRQRQGDEIDWTLETIYKYLTK